MQLLDISRFRKNTGNRKFQLKNYTCFLPRYVVHTPLQYTSESLMHGSAIARIEKDETFTYMLIIIVNSA